MQFGPDGYLYIGLGDDGSAADPEGSGQDFTSMLGAMLRIYIDGASPYEIPDSNPFIGNADALDEIWVTGLRNPWKYSFDSETGDLWIADVGQNKIEEINMQPAASKGGENYGWNCLEGNNVFIPLSCSLDSTDYTYPVHTCNHGGGACSITGGYVYRGFMHTNLQGHYIYADFCNGKIWSIYNDAGT